MAQTFYTVGIYARIKGNGKTLNDMLKRQAKLNTETKELKKLKKKLMDEVVLLADAMGERPTKKQDKEMADHKRLIEECNEKMDAYEEELVELPRQINQLNNQLMLITMDVCCKKLQQNTKELSEIEEWISGIRRELKKKVVRKQEKEAVINRLYAYMHDIFGAEVIELFRHAVRSGGKIPQEGDRSPGGKPGKAGSGTGEGMTTAVQGNC